jgi:polysaccharide pyruvyl transferase CsaB
LSIKIALSGYYGFDNAGDEALLAAITSSLKKLEPQAEFVVFSGSPVRTKELHGIRAVYYLNPFALLFELMRADLLISGGGSIFQDVTSTRSLSYYICVVALARLLKKPVIFYAQGVGPINRSFSKLLMRLVANRVNLITLRDDDSRLYLEKLQVTRPPLIVTADPVFALEPDHADELKMKQLINALVTKEKPLIGVSVRSWKYLQGYEEVLAKLLDKLVLQGYQVVFIPMAYPEDITASRQVAGLMRQDAVIVEQSLTSTEHLALISHLEVMIGMRLHALIFAASRGIPFAGIAYDPKVESFLKLFGLSPLPLEFNAMKKAVEFILKDKELQNALRQKALHMRQKSEDNARLALTLVKKQHRLAPGAH